MDPLISEGTSYQFSDADVAGGGGISQTLLLCCCRTDGNEPLAGGGGGRGHALVDTDDR